MANNKLTTNLNGKFALTLAIGLAICSLGGCQQPDPKPAPAPTVRTKLPLLNGPDGKPIIRVLLTPSAINSADLSAGRGFKIVADQKIRTSPAAGPAPGSTIRRSGGLWFAGAASFKAPRLIVAPTDNRSGRYVGFGSKTYRGTLHLIPKGPAGFIVINYVNFDDYLAGVLARELFGSWHIEAYRSLAVAARTFALHHMLHNKRSREYDVDDTVSSQVYGGLGAETQKSRHAVDSTAGWTLTVKLAGKNRIFMPQYSSCCGGWVNAAIVLRDAPAIAPLAGGQKDLHCTASKRYRWAPVRVSKAELFARLSQYHPSVAALGSISTIQVTQQLTHGRPVWVNIIGPGRKSVRLRAEKIRLALIFSKSPAGKKLYSMNCQIVDVGNAIEFRNGRGFGHGVGMCQYGLQGKAMAGWKASRIISFYYPGADIVKLY
jgi:stage II sporulation protein D